jgi:uncharacterized membrane protein YfcA
MLTLPLLATFALGVLVTSFLSGIFGMAGGMLLMGILLAIMPLSAAMVLHGITQMASNGWRAVLWREHIAWRIVAWFALGCLLAALAFALVLVVPSKAVALLMLGLIPFLAMAVPAKAQLNVARPGHAVASGAICMVLQLLAGVSGPILDLFFVQSGLDRRGIISTKATVQTLGHALKLVYFGAALLASGETLSPWVALLAIALAMVGTTSARRVLEAMSDDQFRLWSRMLIMALSMVYLVQGTYLLVTT